MYSIELLSYHYKKCIQLNCEVTTIRHELNNSIEYMSYSGNLTIQTSHHLIQFVILEGFFKEVLPKKINMYECNFKHSDERGFVEAHKIVIGILYFH